MVSELSEETGGFIFEREVISFYLIYFAESGRSSASSDSFFYSHPI
jgi:hypothetical protein